MNDGWLWRWKVLAGVLSMIVLVGFFVTSLIRTPEDAWTTVSGACVVVLGGLLVHAARRRRRSR